MLMVENQGDANIHTNWYLPRVERKNRNATLGGKKRFQGPVKTVGRTCN